ncbi:hypothetical protein RUM43_003270 [Polyplax serrata]|uniref:Uncharacterized protein n=1 Tax=Polyplax serrata TaxID=468196 RepID=A0AAN8RWW9_POLSC
MEVRWRGDLDKPLENAFCLPTATPLTSSSLSGSQESTFSQNYFDLPNDSAFPPTFQVDLEKLRKIGGRIETSSGGSKVKNKRLNRFTEVNVEDHEERTDRLSTTSMSTSSKNGKFAFHILGNAKNEYGIPSIESRL